MKAMTHWLLVTSPTNFVTMQALQFRLGGMKDRWLKVASQVRPGDTIFFYMKGLKAIGGEVRVVGEYYEDRVPIESPAGSNEFYPYRFPTEPVKIRPPDNYLPVESFLKHYEYAGKWPAKNWTLAFQGNVHRLGQQDYELIHNLL